MGQKLNGSAIVAFLNSDKIVHTTDATLTFNQELPEANTKDSGGWADHIHGVRNWELSIEGYATYDSDGNVADISDLILDRQTAQMEFVPNTDYDGSGNPAPGIDSIAFKFTGEVDASTLELGAPQEETATMSSTLTGKGPISKETVT